MNSQSYGAHKEFSTKIENICLKLHVDEPVSANDAPAYHIMHDHAANELFVCGKGEISIQFQSGILNLSKGEAAIIPKGMLHTRRPGAKDAEWHAITFLCSRLSVASELDLYKILSPVVDCERVVIFKNVQDVFERAEKIIDMAYSSTPLLPSMHMTELLLACVGSEFEIFDLVTRSEENDPSENDGDLDRIVKLDRLVYTNYTQNLTAEEIASTLFISSRQLDRISRKRYGKPLHRVIVDRRISCAEKMLIESDLTVDKISAAIGFGSRSGFYREFERKHGMTPHAYRKKNK